MAMMYRYNNYSQFIFRVTENLRRNMYKCNNIVDLKNRLKL